MQIVFEVETAHGKFSDALYFEDDAVPDDATIEAMKQQRIDNWIAAVTALPTEDIQAAKEAIEAAIKAVEAALAAEGN